MAVPSETRRRVPVPGAIGLAATVSGTAVAALAGHPGAVVAGGAAVLAMAVWWPFTGASAPPSTASSPRRPRRKHPGRRRALQRQWDHVINARVALQAVAVASLCAALSCPDGMRQARGSRAGWPSGARPCGRAAPQASVTGVDA